MTSKTLLQTETVTTRVGDVQVRRGGEAGTTPVVYLHSAQGEGEGLEFLERLAEHRAIVAPLFPGFGDSEGIDQVDDMDDAVFHLLDLWDRLGFSDDPPAVVGLSLGGWMAVELATRYPEKVGALVLVNPAGLYLQGHPIKDIFGRPPGELAEDLFHDQSHPVAQLMHTLNELSSDVGRSVEIPFEMIKPLAATMAATAKLAWDPYLHNPKLPRRLWRVTCPTLVVRGAQDTLIPPAHAQYYAANIAGARYVEVPDAAHMLPWEKPTELAAIVSDFLSTLTPGDRQAQD
jgi:2-hydroxy-6-oxonona-2,4-dienedioate hydrolase